MTAKRLWIALTIIIAALLLWNYLVPGLLESQSNLVRTHEPWKVGNRAAALHRDSLVVDLHADPLLWKRDWLRESYLGHTDLVRMQRGGIALQVFTAVTKSPAGQNYESNSSDTDMLTWLSLAQLWPPATWKSPFARAVFQGERLAEWDRRGGTSFSILRNRSDLEALLAARRGGQNTIGAIFGIEGGHALEGRIENLDALDALGLRVVGLTHFFDNRLGGSLHGKSREGLTPFGRSVIEEAEGRGMTIDVAHASPAMVRDVLEVSRKPVLLSHGGFREVCDRGRNLDDDLMRELATHGALVGVGFWAGAVCDTTPRGIARSIHYGIDLLGVEHIALGSDYDGATEVDFDVGELPALTQAMLDEGLTESEIRSVLGENAVAFFRRNLPAGPDETSASPVP